MNYGESIKSKIEAYKNRTLIKKELLVTLMDEEVQGFRFSEALNGFVIYLK